MLQAIAIERALATRRKSHYDKDIEGQFKVDNSFSSSCNDMNNFIAKTSQSNQA